MENWDIIIIGAGSAGLSAGIYAVRSGLNTLILDEKFAGGTIADASTVVNYPGFAEISWWRACGKNDFTLQKGRRNNSRHRVCY